MAQQVERMAYEEFAGNLDRVFEQIRDQHRPILVERDGETYRLERDEPEDIWKDYDPERVKKALAASAGILKGVDVDALIADLYAQREQGPNRFS